jgi:fatty-acid desaturase
MNLLGETAVTGVLRRPDLGAPLVRAGEGRVEVGWWKIVWLYAVLASAALAWWLPPSPGELVVSATLLGVTLCAGHSVGLHRGIIHRTYRCSRFLRGLLVYLFVHTGIGGPVSWIRLHHVRDHYQNAASCPRYFGYTQSLAQDFFWNLHLRFVPKHPERYAVPEADETDRWLLFLERTWALHVMALFGLVYWGFGLSAAVWLVSVRVAVSVVGHWFIGFLAHKYGYVRYELDGSPEIGRNLLVLGALSFGEGFHNNHHANPGSARMGEAWYELDLGYALLCLLERLGLVTHVQRSGADPRGSAAVRRENARPVPLSFRGAGSARPVD